MRSEEGGLQVPNPCSLHKGQVPMFNGWVQGSLQRGLPSAAAIATKGSSKNPSSMVILNVCRVANELCWLKKKNKRQTQI